MWCSRGGRRGARSTSLPVLLFLAGSLLAETPREEPVGLILLPGAGKLLRASSETPLDSLRGGEIVLESKALKIKSGKLSGVKPVSELSKANQPADALEQLRAAAKLDDQNASLGERIRDVEHTLNHGAESRAAYATALKLESENANRKRLRTKMAF